MPVRVVRLGSPRAKDEGPRLGTVRRPPRGVAKADFAKRDFYDLWLPDLAPSEALLKKVHAAAPAPAPAPDGERAWDLFAKAYRREMQTPTASRLIALLALLSQGTSFSVGCYCADENRCHRSLLRAMLVERGAKVV
ncbi:MAG: DUF488 family protein [Alphaproteobacteria bacterium]|nr:DUF488 family protein [Alphaproteobacteria bacterium]